MRKLWLLIQPRLAVREAGFHAVVGAALSFVGDVMQVFGPILTWMLIGIGVMFLVALVWSVALLKPWPASEIKARAYRSREGRAGRPALPAHIRFAASTTLFLLIASVFALGTLLARLNAPQETDARGFYATVIPALGGIQQSLRGVERDLGEIKGTLKEVKRETSEDPRKELANLGVSWSGVNFLSAVKDGDERTLKLFLSGGMHAETAESQGRSLPVMLALNQHNPGEVLDLLIGAGLDPNQAFPLASGMGPKSTTLIGRAIEEGNVAMVQALIRHHADLNRPIETFGAMGMARQTYPLASAVLWKQYEIAELLLDAGADKGVGDYAAYRALQSAGDGPADLASRIAPTGAAGDKVNLELKLKEVERRLNQIALESLRAPPGSPDRAQYDQRYNELQQERTKLQRALGISN